jgi:hypothetical protein
MKNVFPQDLFEIKKYSLPYFNESEFEYNSLLANLLQSSILFNNKILAIREQISKIKDKEGKKLAIGIQTISIMNEYQLFDDWYSSINRLILENVLYIPNTEPIKIHIPYDIEPIKMYPALYFPHKISARELIDWLKKNRAKFEDMQNKSPKKIKFNMLSENELLIGRAVWLLRKDGYAFTKIYKFIQDFNFKLKKPDLWISNLNENQIKRFYSYFLKHLIKINISTQSLCP